MSQTSIKATSKITVLEDHSLVDFMLIGEEIVMKRINKKGKVYTSRLFTKAEARQLKEAFEKIGTAIINGDPANAALSYSVGYYDNHFFQTPKARLVQFVTGFPAHRVFIFLGGERGGLRHKFSTRNPQNLLFLADALEDVL